MALNMHEGKNIERVMVGEVKHPVSEKRYQDHVLKHGIHETRRQLTQVLPLEMEKVRKDQAEKSPSNPKVAFGKNLLADLDEAMGGLSDLEDGRYELRFYSSADTVLDYAGSFDCWVEVYDLEKNKVLADFKIDVTSNPDKKAPRNLADSVVYCDQRYINDELPGRIEKKFFEDPQYKEAVRLASEILKERAKIQWPV
jgi:hypothetical protein